jgi:hypothetical protein
MISMYPAAIGQPVAGQARHAGDGSQDRGQDDADTADQQRVEQADHKGAAVSIGWFIGNQSLANLKGRFPSQEP